MHVAPACPWLDTDRRRDVHPSAAVRASLVRTLATCNMTLSAARKSPLSF